MAKASQLAARSARLARTTAISGRQTLRARTGEFGQRRTTVTVFQPGDQTTDADEITRREKSLQIFGGVGMPPAGTRHGLPSLVPQVIEASAASHQGFAQPAVENSSDRSPGIESLGAAHSQGSDLRLAIVCLTR